jgi:hypothetical protein
MIQSFYNQRQLECWKQVVRVTVVFMIRSLTIKDIWSNLYVANRQFDSVFLQLKTTWILQTRQFFTTFQSNRW